jgi:ATP/maltotriose-dependent transcriptional regulator MalT
MTSAVVGRDEELAAIRTFLGRIGEGPCALVLSGEAGIGKTVLWETGVEEAEQRGVSVMVGRGSEAEASLSFAGLSDLLAPVFDDVAASLLPPRRRALEIALLRVEPGDEPPDPHAIGLAVLDALSSLARQGPVLVALDDVQWLDSSTAAVIQIALRRLRDERVGLLVTLRTGPELTIPLELGRSYAEGRLEQLTIGPLSIGAVHGLLQERLGLELTRPELARVQEATAGNPFFALELGRELVRTGSRPTPGQALRVPESLRELLGDRLFRLPAETVDVLLFVAALARPNMQVVAAAHGNREGVLSGLEAAVRECVVELDEDRLRFSHPLLASICYEEAPVWKRRAVHRALAEAVGDVEERARHLALAVDGPDAVAASSLDAASEHSAARGATAGAAEFSELAAELTPNDPALARRRRFRSASLFRIAGDTERAVTMLEALLAEVPPGVERADVLFELAVTEARGASARDLCSEALVEATGDDIRSARILGLRCGLSVVGGDLRAARDDATAALATAERAGDPTVLAQVIAYAGQTENYSGEAAPELLERGLAIEESLNLQLEWNLSPRYVLGRRLMRLGEFDRARTLLEEVESHALDRGDELSRAMALWALALVEWGAGRWDRALERATAAHELTEQIQHPHAKTWVGRAKALIEVDLGLVEQARLSAAEALASARATSHDAFAIVIVGMLGRLELELGNLEAAGEYLRDLPGQLIAGDVNDPTLPLWSDAIETLVALGELELARDYLARYEANAERFGSHWAAAAAQRCRGLLTAAEGDVDVAYATFEQSLTRLDEHPFPLERGRTLLALGRVRRQAGQKRTARETLEQALAIFEELGAPLWAEQARAELARISGRAPSAEELTETERRVAELAAQGRRNKEIAAELYMGVSTVESHLSHVYRKLGVRRAELAGRLAVGVDAPQASTDEDRTPSLS